VRNAPARRRVVMEEIFAEDCMFHEPKGVYPGRDEIDRVAGVIKALILTFSIAQLARPRS
jgi:hypothetical protein